MRARPEAQRFRSELAHRSEVGVVFEFVRRGDAYRRTVQLDVGAQAAQHLGHQRHIEDVGAVGDGAGAFGQQRRRHQLENAVFCSPNSDFARQPAPAGHHETLGHAG